MIPSNDSIPTFIRKLNKLSGWRLRAEIRDNIEEARMSLSASQVYYETTNWPAMFLEIQDAFAAMEKLKETLERNENSQIQNL